MCEPKPALERVVAGRDCTGRLLEGRQDFDAVFAASDLIAIGVLEKLADCGIHVPQEVAVVGYGGVSAGETCHPPLTTIEADLDDAAERLVEATLAGGQKDTRERSKVKLLRRSSVRRPADGAAMRN